MGEHFNVKAQQGDETNTMEPTVTNTLGSTETQIMEDITPTFTPSSTDIIETVTLEITPPATITPIKPPIIFGAFVSDEVLIRFKRQATEESMHLCLSQVNAEIESQIEELSVYLVNVDSGRVPEAIAVLNTCPDIRYAEPNYLAQIADTIPSDPGFAIQYGLVNIRAPQGWDLSTGSASVTIAIIDTGVDLSHPDLAGKIVGGYDFVNDDNSAQDDNGHGTHVAGIAAASGDNGTGVAGVSWGARLMPIKVLNSAGNGSFSDVAAGIIWAADSGAQIINLSLGGASNSVVLQGAVDYASSRGVILVAAAGNTGANFVLYPAHYSNVIAVAATDNTNTHASFSNYGPEIDLSAPGASIYSTSPGATYIYRSGTSMAAPYVSGLAAVLLGIPGNGGSGAITLQMAASALDLGLTGWDDFYGQGLIQMDAAIRLALPATATPPGNQYNPPLLPGIPFYTLPFTPSLTPSPVLTPIPTETAATYLTAPSISETAEVSALSNVTPTVSIRPTLSSKLGSDWPLGALGGLLILGGLSLLWNAARRRKRKYGKFTH